MIFLIQGFKDYGNPVKDRFAEGEKYHSLG